MFLCVNRVAKEGYITGNFISLPVNLQNFGIFQGFYIFSGPFVNFRLSQVSVIISGPLSGLIPLLYEIIT
jgi:hypothetical protein